MRNRRLSIAGAVHNSRSHPFGILTLFWNADNMKSSHDDVNAHQPCSMGSGSPR